MRERGRLPIFAGAAAKIFGATEKIGVEPNFGCAGRVFARWLLRSGGFTPRRPVLTDQDDTEEGDDVG